MALDKITGTEILKKTIQGDLRHRDYKHVVEVAKKWTRLVTGEDVHEELKQFKPRVSDEEFKQIKDLFQSTTSDIANRLRTPMYKVGRTTPQLAISWEAKKNSDEMRKKLDEGIIHYFGNMSVTDYLTIRMPELDNTDPNSFIVTEFDGTYDPAKPEILPQPYPFEVNSEEAINYKFVNNILQFLIVLNNIDGMERYTLYLDNVAVVAQEITKEMIGAFMQEFPAAVIWRKDESNKESKHYAVTEYNHNAGIIPAMIVGSRRDLTTRGRTYVPMIDPAKPYFEKVIKTVSEFDLTNCLHTFPQKIQYDEVCLGDMEKGIMCQNGRVYEDGSDKYKYCSVCKGTGYKTHTSAMDIIRVKYPKDISNGFPSLDNYLTYKAPPMDLLKYQKDLGLYELPELAVKAVYASELFSPDTVAATATEKGFDMESVYDTITPFADHWSAMWTHITMVIAAYRNVSKGIHINHQFPKDFKMKSLTAMLDDLSKANTSGAASYVKTAINRDIMKKLYTDQPYELLKIEVKEKYYPFPGKTENEILNILTNDLCSKQKKILYANFDAIFDDIETETNTDTTNFYRMDAKLQADLVNKKVQQYMDEIDNQVASERAASIGSFKPEEQTELENEIDTEDVADEEETEA